MRPDVLAPSPVLRFAPSPNGFLHLGHAYSALMNARAAAAMNGRLLLRFDDLDRTRSRAQYESAIERDLEWLGLRFEAPARRQSDHVAEYDAAFGRLAAQRLVYPCFCSRVRVARFSMADDPNGAPVYSGACRSLPADDVAERLAQGDSACWRLAMQRALESVLAPDWIELGEGLVPSKRAAEPALWGDIVLRGRGSAASYHLAVVVDDALLGVTDVMRGRDLLASTSLHRLLQVLLGLPAPRYRHHRLVLDSSGAKLSKSRQSPSLATLRESGVAASEIRAALGLGEGVSARCVVNLS
jgi:glutamyl-Q tRNA(Asp) synthetase